MEELISLVKQSKLNDKDKKALLNMINDSYNIIQTYKDRIEHETKAIKNFVSWKIQEAL